MIDPAGLALENFDAIGAWRTRDGGTRGTPVDASGQLVDGTQVNGVVELRQALLREPETFVETMTEKLLTYALGRGLTAADMPAVRAIVRDAAKDQYRFSSIVLGIVRSVPFQMRLKAPGSETAGRSVGRSSSPRSARTQRVDRGARHVHHQVVAVPSNGAAWHRRHAGAAAARRHGAGADADGAHRRDADAALRRGLRPDGRAAQPLDAADHRRRLRVQPDSEAAREVPRPRQRGLEPRSAAAGHARRQHRHLADRHGAQAHRGRGLPRRHLARSDHRQADRAGHRLPVARDRHRGLRPATSAPATSATAAPT